MGPDQREQRGRIGANQGGEQWTSWKLEETEDKMETRSHGETLAGDSQSDPTQS